MAISVKSIGRRKGQNGLFQNIRKTTTEPHLSFDMQKKGLKNIILKKNLKGQRVKVSLKIFNDRFWYTC